MKKGTVKIGTMGFSYKDWVGNFYPKKTPASEFLRLYSRQFDSVEIDSTFYRIPSAASVGKWASIVPEGFSISAKFPQAVTHEGTIEDRVSAANQFIRVMKGLGEKQGVMLMQFPYGFKPDQAGLFLELLDGLEDKPRIAVEFRNRKWMNDNLYQELQSRQIGLCLVEHPWMPRLAVTTADFAYVRLLGDRKQIEDDFSHVRFEREAELQWWSRNILDLTNLGLDVLVYPNNHFSGHSPTTASRLREILGQVGSAGF